MKVLNAKWLLPILCLLLIVGLIMVSGCAAEAPVDEAPDDEPIDVEDEDEAVLDRLIEAKLASEEIEGDFMTVWAENFADHMLDWSSSMFQLDVYPYGTLGDTRDINELAQLGVVEYVFSDFAWMGAFVPEATVFGLHYIWPEERPWEVMEWVVRNGDSWPIIVESFRREGLVPLSIMFEGWQWITSDSPIRTVDDMVGFDVRIMGSDMLNAQYLALGASPTPMSYGEVYSGLQTGLIDGQVNPIFAIRSMNFYDVQDYFTQIYAEPFVGIPTINMVFFDSLPENVKEQHREWWADAIVPAADWINTRHETDLNAMTEERPEIEVIHVTGAEQERFKEKAMDAHQVFLEIGGPNAQAVYDALMQDIEKAKVELGIAN
ncbi:MAG: TRAP transporter substrate-binding protein DctP [Bacillota bacterium]|nr:TRAP transporter substrate-binding protein DctP [Bacillota bacterium]